ncbi:MAG: hypothetical protein GWN99_12220 [Gemmatimonadetes bacterium]|uniref:Uncharacterized protein n=1 Tax=Candidatus Kutchimonas denitrificans TaxID=3056748 RepID=A0AAE5CB85_9BACT|nr:hypothetical protein [Gemmatimonadota bacterium]NIR75497.1 hypothetical protein [Candidatus Kutchimonas denitrificans]NIS01811.1 hypothetical protein [Gemmatimonadota bacterium]NIT67592.1 hypothetical protein [Gemmatimonadota bacterium]NIU53466.1 hypothetical protein [Gemmatimonadota bacterium]
MRFGSSEASCTSCHQLYAASDLDRYLWCPNCRKQLERRGTKVGRAVGVVASAGLAAYLVVEVHPSARFVAIYLLLLVMTYTLTSRIARAVVQGFYRSRALGGVVETENPE